MPTVTVTLGPEWGIETSADLQATLAASVDASDDVVLAVAEARRVHTASLQVLAAFFRTRGGAGRSTRIEPCADPLRDAAALLGLATEIGLSSSSSKSQGLMP